jgi:hypothetical protein
MHLSEWNAAKPSAVIAGFNTRASEQITMDTKALFLLFICIAAIALAGCTTQAPQSPAVATPTPAAHTSINLTAAPQRYSPMMSSTVGIGMEVNATGFDPATARFTWNATYGKFLSWGPVDYTVKDSGTMVTNHGEKLYWSYAVPPASTAEPVVVMVTATDPATGTVLGTSTMTLDWDGKNGVVVKKIT